MAQNIGEAQINLSVNTSQMEREVSAALKRLESRGFNIGAGINAKAFTQPLGRITGAANEFQKSLDASNARVIAFGASAGAIYNVQRAFTALISSTIDVQKSLTDINVILGASQKTLGQFSDQLFEIARNSGQAFSTVATAAGELARQGLSVEQTLKRTNDALILARLSGLDAASSVEALTASINSFNKSALDSNQIVNKLAAVDSAFAVSSGDLAEALKRVGSSAEDVGVSFDQLLAIVASVNQTTARGGAVIGNSLKTIFTRVQRTDVLNQLESLGVAVRDLSGNTAPAIQILSGLAQKFDQLSDAQKSQVSELVGGVFQINILKAALGDLSREYSVYGNALKIATNASNEAVVRNEELNKTLSALLNRTLANLTKVGSEIGALTLQPAIEKVLGGLNTALESFDVKGDGIGSKIGKGIFEGIGSFISGPGLALLIGVFGKIFLNLTRFTTDAVKTVLGLNKEAQAQAQIQERINSILAQNPILVQNILNKQVSLLQVEKDILTVIQAQAQARQQTTTIAATLTKGLISKGVVAEKGAITTTRAKSQGFIPNYSANKEIMGAIAGGYMPGNIRSMNIPNYGRITYNDAETVKQFSGLTQPGIMPPENSDAGKAYKEKFKNKYGIDPYASKGFIPNFATSTNRLVNQGYKVISGDVYNTLSKVNSPFKKYVKGSSAGGFFLDSNVEDKAIQYYKSQTESSILSKGKGILSKEQVEKTGAVLVYPAFGNGGLGSTTATALKHKGKTTDNSPEFLFSTFGFPGPNGGIGPKLYDNVQRALKEEVYNFIAQATLNPKDLFDDARFDNYVNTNINRSTIEAAVGGIFEAGLKSSIFSAVDNPNAPLDLSAAELKKLSTTFKGAEPLASFSLGEVKNALNPSQAASMADKIASSKGYPLKSQGNKMKAFGFIPNFSPLDKALKTEKMMGGEGVLDYQQGIGLYVRDSKTQPNFAAVMRDHPEGIQTATKNSKIIQGIASTGFVPNMLPIRQAVMSTYGKYVGPAGSLTQLVRPNISGRSLAGGGISDQSAAQLQRSIDKITKMFDKGSLDIDKATQQISNRLQSYTGVAGKKLVEAETSISKTLSKRQEVTSKGFIGSAIGGIGNLNTRFENTKFGRLSKGLESKALLASFAAPIVTETIGNLVPGGQASRTGRTISAAASGIGDIASYASIGSLFGPIGTAVGGIVGTISAGTKVWSAFNDKTIDYTASLDAAKQKLNDMTFAVQNISTATENLDRFQTGDFGGVKDPRIQAELIAKENAKLAEGLAKLDKGTRERYLELSGQGKKPEAQAVLGMALEDAQKEAARRQSILTLAELEKSKTFKNLGQGGIQGLAAESQVKSAIEPLFKDLSLEQLKAITAATNPDNLKTAIESALPKAPPELIEQLVELLANNRSLLDGVLTIKETATRINQDQKNGKPIGPQSLTDLQRLLEQSVINKTPLNLTGLNTSGILTSPEIQNAQKEAASKPITDAAMAFALETNDLAKSSKMFNEYISRTTPIIDKFNAGLISATEKEKQLGAIKEEILLREKAATMSSKDLASTKMSIRNAKGVFEPGESFLDSFGMKGQDTVEKLNQSFANLAENLQTGFEDAFGSFVDGTKTAEDAFRDMMLNISQQIIKEQFSIGMRSLLGGLTGGGGFGGTSDNSGGLLGGIFNSIFGGGKAKGGIIKKYSSGGHVQGGTGIRDDVPAMLTDGEYVLRKSAVNKYGIDALNMLNRGGMIKGYATGGGVSSFLSNRYDFYGPNGDLLTGQYTPEAFKTTVNAPEELSKVPALTGKFNISDLLSSRAITDEDNPMNQLRTQRFMGMQNYQQQVSNFKTSYNEQMRQVEEQRREAQKAADEENSRRMAAYNRQVSQGFIGGLFSAGLSLFSGMGGFSGIGNILGGGSSGGGLFSNLSKGFSGLGNMNLFGLNPSELFSDVLGRGKGLVEQALNQSASYGSMSTSIPGLTERQKKAMSDAIENGQLTGFADPFARQNQLFPQYGSQTYGYAGAPFTPTSSVGGFMYNVGLGTPAGFQTRTQTTQDFYNVMAASPIPPIGTSAVARGVAPVDQQRLAQLMYLSNPNINPFGFAKGGIVKGYQIGGIVPQRAGLSKSVINSIIQSEGRTGIQSGRKEYFGFRSGTGEFNEIRMFAKRFGINSPQVKELVGNLLTARAEKAGALNFKDPGVQGAIMSMAHMRGEGGAQAILNSVAGSAIQKSGKLTQDTIDKINMMDPLVFQSALRQKRLEYDKAIYGSKIDSVVVNGKTKTGKWWDLFGKGLTNRYQKEQELFSSMSVPEFKNFAQNVQQSTQVAGTNQSITGKGFGAAGLASLAGLPFLSSRIGSAAQSINTISRIPLGMTLGSEVATGTATTGLLARALPFLGRANLYAGTAIGSYMAGNYLGEKTGLTNYLSSKISNQILKSQGIDPDQFQILPDGSIRIPPSGLASPTMSSSPSRQSLLTPQISAQKKYTGIGDLYNQVGLARNPLSLNPQIPSYLNRFAPFYGSGSNYFNTQGNSGFQQYMKYLGIGTGTSLSTLSSFNYPRTPTTISPYAFASSTFGGGAISSGMGMASAASTYFSAGSRLGIAPSWASRATGGPIYGGTSYKDDVPAMLMGGEYVIRKDVVDRMGEPFFNKLNRGQISGFAEGGPVGTGLPSIGALSDQNGQDNSKAQFVEALTKLLKSLDQLNRSVEDQTKEIKDKSDLQETSTQDTTQGGGVTNNINISVNVDQNGQTSNDKKDENQDSQGNDMNDQEKFKKTMERSRVLAELLRQQILKVIVEEQRPGGVLYQGSKGRDLGR